MSFTTNDLRTTALQFKSNKSDSVSIQDLINYIIPDLQNITLNIGGGGGGSGTVTSVSVVTANGVSGSVATATTTPAITIVLGAITPSSIASSGTITGSNLAGTNNGDQVIAAGNGISVNTVGLTTTVTATGSGTGTVTQVNAGTNLTITAGVNTVNPTLATIQNPTFTTSVTSPIHYGSSSSGGTLTLSSTSHATKGNIYLGSSSGLNYDEVNNRVGIGVPSPQEVLSVHSTASNGTCAIFEDTAAGADHAGILLQSNTTTWGVYSAQTHLVLSNISNSGLDVVTIGNADYVFDSGAASYNQMRLINSSGAYNTAIGCGGGYTYWVYDNISARYRLTIMPTNGNIGLSVDNPKTTLDVGGAITLEPIATVTLTAASTTVTVGNTSYIKVASDNAVAANRILVLPQSTFAGQQLTIDFSGSSGAWQMVDNAAQGTAGNMRLNGDFVAGPNSTIHLHSNGLDWIEDSRSVN